MVDTPLAKRLSIRNQWALASLTLSLFPLVSVMRRSPANKFITAISIVSAPITISKLEFTSSRLKLTSKFRNSSDWELRNLRSLTASKFNAQFALT